MKNPTVLPGLHIGGVTCVKVVGEMIYTAGVDQRVLRHAPDGSLGELIRFADVRLYPREPKAKPYAAWFDISHGLIACAMKHGIVEIHDVASGKHIRSLENPPVGSAYHRDFDSVAFHPGDPNLIAGSNGRYAVVWDATTGQQLWRDTMGSRINTTTFLGRGKHILLQEWDPLLRILNWPGGKSAGYQFEMVEGSWNLVTSRACPVDGKIDFAVSALDADGGVVLGMKLGHEKPVFKRKMDERIHDIDFTLDGRHLLAGGDRGILRIFDTRSKKSAQIDLGKLPEVSALPPGSSSSMILCTRELEHDSYPNAAIHCISCSSTGDWAAVGLVGGLLLKVPLPRPQA
jgi:WD40 repeat protein